MQRSLQEFMPRCGWTVLSVATVVGGGDVSGGGGGWQCSSSCAAALLYWTDRCNVCDRPPVLNAPRNALECHVPESSWKAFGNAVYLCSRMQMEMYLSCSTSYRGPLVNVGLSAG
jgi:hypothetical protein|eukprot:SAG25_NODE_542_length_7058_cov_1.916942_2_plen_115_part_00